MPEALAAPTATNEAPAAEELSGSVEERADAIFGPDVIDDGSGDEGAPDDGVEAPAPPQKAPDQLAQERAARRAQTLAELKAKTRDGVDQKAARSEAERLRRELEQERAQRVGLVDPRKLTPLQILELGGVAGHTPASIAEALRNAQENPEYVATHAARKAIDPELAQLREQNHALTSRLDTFLEQHAKQQETAAETAAHREFNDYATSNATVAPYAASFLKAYGPDEFQTIVKHVLPNVVGGGAQGVLDEVEEFLSARHKEVSVWNPTAVADPQRSQANPPRHSGPATQVPTHVTNSLAQSRSSVVDEDAALLEAMPYEERASFIFRRR